MARDRLSGEYGKLATGALGSEETTTFADGTYYIVSGVDASTALTGSAAVGYLYRGGGETLASGDAGYPITFTNQCDIKSWNLDFAIGEIDVTGLCDNSTVFVKGKTDVTGSIEGTYTIGTTDSANGFQNQVVDIVKQAAATYTIDAIDTGNVLYAFLYTQKATTAGETESLYVAPIITTGFTHGVAINEAQAFSSGMRITSDDTNNVKFHYFEYTHA